MKDTTGQQAAEVTVSWRELVLVWGRIGLISFGGPAGQIALMHREIVEKRGWLGEQQFLNAVSFCMLLPGPEAMQVATYSGWRLKGTLGGLIAGSLFVLPGAVVVATLAAVYVALGNVPLVGALMLGMKAAVVVVVVEALLRVGRRSLGRKDHWIVAGLAFIALFFFALPYPAIVLAAAIYGLVTHDGSASDSPPPPRHTRTLATAVLWATIWAAPPALLALTGADGFLLDVGLFFSKLAVVTFGGAYAVLAYMAQDVVQGFGWLTPGEMLDGLGLAETTPGPLILVTEFVGFVAGAKAGGWPMAMAAAAITLWVTFVPCFLWIFVGAPYIDQIAAQPRLRGALLGIAAAVVGVILNLSVWFALHVFFARVTHLSIGPVNLWLPDIFTVEPVAVSLAAISAVLLLRLHLGLIRVLALSSSLGVVWALFTGVN